VRPAARWVLAAASLALFGGVLILAVSLGPPEAGFLPLAFAVLAGAAVVQSLTSEPRDLIPALVLALLPVIALAAPASPTWLIGPLAVLLLLAAELNALSWDCRGPFPMSAAQRRRLVDIGVLVLLALGGVLVVEAVVAGGVAGGRIAAGLAALALAGLGLLMFQEGGADLRPPPAPGPGVFRGSSTGRTRRGAPGRTAGPTRSPGS
jgi:hypothetical protein